MEPQITPGVGPADFGFAGEAAQPQAEVKERGVEHDGHNLPCAAQVLRAIGDGRVTYASLVSRFTFTRARLGYLLRQLEQSDLIARRRLWGDRRRVEIELTPDGRDHLARVASGAADALVGRRARAPRHGASGVVPRDIRGVAPDKGADVVAVFCDLIRYQLDAMPPEERISVGAAVVMALSSLGHPDTRGATCRTDLESLVGDLRASALAISGGNPSPLRRDDEAARPAGSNSHSS